MWPNVPISIAKNVTRRLGYWDLESDKPRLKNSDTEYEKFIEGKKSRRLL